MNGRNGSIGSGKAGILPALVCLLLIFFAASAAAEGDLVIYLSWTGADGSICNEAAQPLGYPGYEDAYWVMADGNALDRLTLHISNVDEPGMQFLPSDGTLLTGVADAGDDLAKAQWIDIASVDKYSDSVRVRLYISSLTPLPGFSDSAAVPEGTVAVRVRYLDGSDGDPLLDDGTVFCPFNDITTVPAAEISGYTPLNSSIEVLTDPNGLAPPAEVVFYYRLSAGPAVTVHYRDVDGNTVSPDTVVECDNASSKLIRAIQINGYTVEGNDTAEVHVDDRGTADVTEVTFVYRLIGPVEVTVRYLNSVTGQDIAEPGTVSCPPGQTASFYAREIPGYVLMGDEVLYMEIGVNGEAASREINFYYSAAETPTVSVSYLFEDGSHAAEDEQIPCPLNSVTPISARNFPGYTVVGDAVQTVTVDGNGTVQPPAVIFVYTPSSAPTVTVKYIDRENGEEISASDTVVLTINANTYVQAKAISGYTLQGQETVYVYVDAQGNVEPAEVVFTYDTGSVPQVAWVKIDYRDITDNTLLYSTTEPCDVGSVLTVAADASLVPQGYELSDDARKTVSVSSADGTEAEVVFWFRKTERAVLPIPVFYRDENGMDVASPGIAELVEGNNAVYAEPMDLKSDYALMDSDVQYVVMDETGQLSRSEVVFYYYLTVTPTPSPTPSAVPYAVSGDPFYARATKDGIYFRSSPSVASMENVIGSVSSSTVIYVVGSLYNDLGEKWYQVDVNGIGGFINANVIAAMSQDEINAVFGFTPTPVPTPIPDGAPIERWGRLNSSKVNFRKDTSTSASVIDRLDKNAPVWIYRSLTVGGTGWYYVRCSGTDGYIMTKFVDLMTEGESGDYQSSLKTPMMTRTPDPTKMATTEVTMTPVPTPSPTAYVTPTPVSTPTAEPYFGYAVTRDQTLMYAIPGGTDDTVTSEVNAGSLVLIIDHSYVGTELWDNVELVGSVGMENTGYMLDTDLEHISNDMVGMYVAAQQTPGTPTAVPTQVPQQKRGFARTVGDNVALRAYADTNAQIYTILAKDTVVSVSGQEYTDGRAWDLVEYGSLWGYIRDDQMVMLEDNEVVAYLDSLRTPTPVPEAAPTPVPVTGSSLTSYGYVTTNKVNMRKAPARTAESIRLLEKYAFALVVGTEYNSDGETWYHISQSGTDGYIMSNYFKVLTMDELTEFLTSDEYRNASDNTSQISDTSAGNIQALEDYNRGIWQNPAVSVSYEPFTVATDTPSPTVVPSVTPTASPRSTYGIGGVAGSPSTTVGTTDIPPQPETKSSGASAAGILLAGASVLLLGGGIYIYHIHRKNERRRRAVREQQARQAARAATHPRTSRAGGETDSRTRRVDAAPFMPPSGAPSPQWTRAVPPSGTESDRPEKDTPFPTDEMDGTRAFPSWSVSGGAAYDRDPWKKQSDEGTAQKNAEGSGTEQTRAVPVVTIKSPGIRADNITPAASSEAPAAEERPARHRRSDRHRAENNE